MGSSHDEGPRQAIEALVDDGRLAEADELAESFLETPSSAAEPARLRLTLAAIQLIRGRTTEALRHAEAVQRERELPSGLRGVAKACHLAALTALRDARRARELAEEILAGRAGSGSDTALASALHTIGVFAWEDGRLSEATSLLRAAAHRLAAPSAAAGRGALSRWYPELDIVGVLVGRGDFDAAERVIDDVSGKLAHGGLKVWAPGLASAAGRLHLAAGRLDSAVEGGQRALVLCERVGARSFVPGAAWVLASAALQRGDLHEAAAQVATCRRELTSSSGGLDGRRLRWADARLCEAQGRDERARELLARVYDRPGAHRLLFVDEPAAAAGLVRAATQAADTTRAEAVVACTDRLAASNPEHPAVQAIAVHARGVFERDAGALDQAARAHAQPWARASAYEDAGTVLCAGDDHHAAVRQLGNALVMYRGAGAVRDAARVERRMRQVERRATCRRQPISGWASLTSTEQDVARLVAEGLTNLEVALRMAMSRHTVDFHLRQIFRKLAIRSRVALARLVGEHTNGSVA